MIKLIEMKCKCTIKNKEIRKKEVTNFAQNQVQKTESSSSTTPLLNYNNLIDTAMTKSAARKRSPKFSFGSKFDLLPGSMIEYAEILLMLASSEPKPEEPNVTLPEISSLTKKSKGVEVFENKNQILDSPKRVDKEKGNSVLEFVDKFCAGTSLALKLEEEYLYTQISKSSENGRLKRKIGKKLKFKETEDDDVEEDKTKKSEYKCSICNRIFQSYQALGGHIAFHYKNQRIKNKNSVKSSISALEEHEPITEVDETEKVIHQCKTFPSPSVSSGVNIQRSVKSNQTNNSSEETIQTFPRVILNFCLNDLPHVEYKQGETSQTDTSRVALNLDLNEFPPCGGEEQDC